MKKHLIQKRNELMWALWQQDYNTSDLAEIFNISRQRVHVIVGKMPKGWSTPWSKSKKV